MGNKRLSEEQKNEIRDMYATGEFSKNEIAGKLGVSISTVNVAVIGMKKPMKKSVTEIRTKRIERHIMSFFDTKEEFVEMVQSAMNAYKVPEVKDGCYKALDAGCLLIYHSDVAAFLETLGCVVSENDSANWSMYKKLVAGRMEKMYERFVKGEE